MSNMKNRQVTQEKSLEKLLNEKHVSVPVQEQEISDSSPTERKRKISQFEKEKKKVELRAQVREQALAKQIKDLRFITSI